MADIKEQIGIQWLTGARRKSEKPPSLEQSASRPFLEEALLAEGLKFLRLLEQAPGETTTLYHIVESLQMPIEGAFKVVAYLKSKECVKELHQDLKGNHELQLTERGRSLLKQFAA